MINQQVLFMVHFYRREISLAFVIEIYLVLLKPGYDWSESKKNDYVMKPINFHSRRRTIQIQIVNYIAGFSEVRLILFFYLLLCMSAEILFHFLSYCKSFVSVFLKTEEKQILKRVKFYY